MLSMFFLFLVQVRAGIVGYPNVGKSSLINRLLKRRMCPAAPRPGVTRELKYILFINVLFLKRFLIRDTDNLP